MNSIITQRRHLKHIYYRPGLISLIILPIICIWYLNKHIPIDKNIPRDQMVFIETCLPNNYNKLKRENRMKNTQFIDFNLTGNDKTDRLLLDSAEIKIRELVASKDSTIGVHFYFSDKSKYWTLIKVIDIVNVEKAIAFNPYQNEIWVINPFVEKVEESN